MTEDKLGKFLFENDVAPDEFSYFRKSIHGEDIAVVETTHSRSFFITDERGRMIYKLAPEIIRLSLLQFNFSVRFIDGEVPKTIASYSELNDDPNQLELISVEYYGLDTQQEDDDSDNLTDDVPIFFSHEGMLISTHPECTEDSTQPPLFE